MEKKLISFVLILFLKSYFLRSEPVFNFASGFCFKEQKIRMLTSFLATAASLAKATQARPVTWRTSPSVAR